MKTRYIYLIAAGVMLFACSPKKKKYHQETGSTMGTTFVVTAGCEIDRGSLDSILTDFSQMFSTYIPTSFISKLNASKDTNTYFELGPKYKHFYPLFPKLENLYEISNTAFNPYAAVLFDAWGFSEKGVVIIDDLSIEELLLNSTKEGFERKGNKIRKKNPNSKLNLNAVAKGFGLDIVASYLNGKGCENYLIEIGGELIAKGVNPDGNAWRIGIRKPQKASGNNIAMAEVNLVNRAMATSGNYENFKTYHDSTIGHTIDPMTGFPAKTRLLSCTVFAEDCLTADALATACMVLGEGEAIKLIEELEKVECFLVYLDDKGEIKTYSSLGIRNDIEIIN